MQACKILTSKSSVDSLCKITLSLYILVNWNRELFEANKLKYARLGKIPHNGMHNIKKIAQSFFLSVLD